MLNLLPIKSESLLVSRKEKVAILSLLQKLTNDAVFSIKAFLRGELKSFDAQVGDTSCQVRAFKIALLSSSAVFIKTLPAYLCQLEHHLSLINQKLLNYLSSSSNYSSYHKELDSKCKIADFMKNNQLEIELPSDLIFIIVSFFLEKYSLKDANKIPYSLDYNLIKLTYKLGSTPARNIANHCQAVLSKLSCEFILSLLKSYPVRDGNHQTLSYFLRMGERGRMMLPYYNETKVLLLNQMTLNTPIMLSIECKKRQKSERITLLFQRKKTVRSIREGHTDELAGNTQSCVVFKGIALLEESVSLENYIDKILSFSPVDLILNNAAAHPQYAGITHEALKRDPYNDVDATDKNPWSQQFLASMKQELISRQNAAHETGSSKENSHLFFITHIFCDLVKNEAQESQFCFQTYFNNSSNTSILSTRAAAIAA